MFLLAQKECKKRHPCITVLYGFVFLKKKWLPFILCFVEVFFIFNSHSFLIIFFSFSLVIPLVSKKIKMIESVLNRVSSLQKNL